MHYNLPCGNSVETPCSVIWNIERNLLLEVNWAKRFYGPSLTLFCKLTFKWVTVIIPLYPTISVTSWYQCSQLCMLWYFWTNTNLRRFRTSNNSQIERVGNTGWRLVHIPISKMVRGPTRLDLCTIFKECPLIGWNQSLLLFSLLLILKDFKTNGMLWPFDKLMQSGFMLNLKWPLVCL